MVSSAVQVAAPACCGPVRSGTLWNQLGAISDASPAASIKCRISSGSICSDRRRRVRTLLRRASPRPILAVENRATSHDSLLQTPDGPASILGSRMVYIRDADSTSAPPNGERMAFGDKTLDDKTMREESVTIEVCVTKPRAVKRRCRFLTSGRWNVAVCRQALRFGNRTSILTQSERG